MRVGIQITAQILEQNNNRFLEGRKIGDIVIRNDYPNAFWVTRRVSCSYMHKIELHGPDGWKNEYVPRAGKDYNPETQKLGNPYIDEQANHITYEIIDLSPEEIDANNEEKDKNQAREKIDTYRYRGGELIEKTRTKMWRRVHLYSEGPMGMTKQQAAKLERWFLSTYQFLLFGNFRQARNEIDGVIEQRNGTTGDGTLDETPGMNDTAVWLQDQITQYFNDRYDL